MSQQSARTEVRKNNNGSLLLGTGLVVASMILVSALAVRLGLGASLTGALMKASSRVVSSTTDVFKAA